MLFDMYMYLLWKEKEITPTMLFSTSQIFKGLNDFRECRLEIKTPPGTNSLFSTSQYLAHHYCH